MRSAYKFTKGQTGDRYVFESIGVKGNVAKAVLFDMEEDGLYSVIMDDVNSKGQLKPFKPSGNYDAKKVFATVADIIEDFVTFNPDAIIFLREPHKSLLISINYCY